MKLSNENSILSDLSSQVGQEWESLILARNRTDERMRDIQNAFSPLTNNFPNCSLILFGSFARGELTANSDLDWTYLVNGPANAAYKSLITQAKNIFSELGFKIPTETSDWGKLTYSHDLVKVIGDKNDPRESLSKRLLLLLESRAIGNESVKDSLIHEILKSYQSEESFLNKGRFVIPRYLLNDIMLFWRQMCTDYAGITRDSYNKAWGIRAYKLSFSRKLIYISGILWCFDYHLRNIENPFLTSSTHLHSDQLYDHLEKTTGQPPIDGLAKCLKDYASPHTTRKILNAYNSFLRNLDDDPTRKHLENLSQKKATFDTLFVELWDGARDFHEGLLELLLGSGASELAILTRACLVI